MRASFSFMKLPQVLGRSLILACACLLAAPLRAAEAPKKVLVVTVTMGFRHSSIPTSEKILSELAAKSGKFTVEFVRQPEGLPPAPQRPRAPGKGGKGDEASYQEAMKKFAGDEKAYWAAAEPKFKAALEKLSPASLKNYDAVMFVSTTGDLPLPDPKAFVDWVAAGKGFVGVHAAADTFHQTGRFPGFPPYVKMLGGAFKTHGPQVTVECINQDPKHGACVHLPGKWTVFDEIYQFKEFDRARVHGLLTLDKLQVDNDAAKQVPGDWPVAWARNHGKGRVFYTSLGHREDVWDPAHAGDAKGGRKNSPEVARQFQQHVLQGILWSLGLDNSPIKHAP
jgi:type 1 glutamine amidotransferase